MYEWNEAIQKAIDWIEHNLTAEPTLFDMARQIGYSPYYCSAKFHSIAGITLKKYVAGRRLCCAALEVRDTQRRILDIALDHGFSSQQAFTRAFVYAYGCTPAAYRKAPHPIPMTAKKEVLFPEYYESQGESTMNETALTQANVRFMHIPAHKYLSIRDHQVQNYCDFWNGRDCDTLCGIIESMDNVAYPLLPCHTGGWFWEDGRRGYSYGLAVPAEYAGPVPDGFALHAYPESYYLVFYHPTFDFLKDCDEVITRVETLAWSFQPAELGCRWNESVCQDYQKLMPETIGYEVLRPVCKI